MKVKEGEGRCSPECKDCLSSAGVCFISLIIISFIYFTTRGITPCPAGQYAQETGPDVKRYNCLPCPENCVKCQDVTGKCFECIETHKLDDDKKCEPACTGNKPGKWNPRTLQCDCKDGLVTLRDSCIKSCPAHISYDNVTNSCLCAPGFKVGPDYHCINQCEKQNEFYDLRFKKCVCQGLEVDEKCELRCADGQYWNMRSNTCLPCQAPCSTCW